MDNWSSFYRLDAVSDANWNLRQWLQSFTVFVYQQTPAWSCILDFSSARTKHWPTAGKVVKWKWLDALVAVSVALQKNVVLDLLSVFHRTCSEAVICPASLLIPVLTSVLIYFLKNRPVLFPGWRS